MKVCEIPKELKIIKTMEFGNTELILCEGKNEKGKEIFAFAEKKAIYEFKIISTVYLDVAEEYANQILKTVEYTRKIQQENKDKFNEGRLSDNG